MINEDYSAADEKSLWLSGLKHFLSSNARLIVIIYLYIMAFLGLTYVMPMWFLRLFSLENQQIIMRWHDYLVELFSF